MRSRRPRFELARDGRIGEKVRVEHTAHEVCANEERPLPPDHFTTLINQSPGQKPLSAQSALPGSDVTAQDPHRRFQGWTRFISRSPPPTSTNSLPTRAIRTNLPDVVELRHPIACAGSAAGQMSIVRLVSDGVRRSGAVVAPMLHSVEQNVFQGAVVVCRIAAATLTGPSHAQHRWPGA